MIPWSPLARGRLARAWQSETTKRSETDKIMERLYGRTEEADRLVVERLTKLASDRGIPQAQLALAWMLQKPYVTAPIIGATKLHHLTDAVAAVDLRLSDEEVQSLEELYVPHPVLGIS